MSFLLTGALVATGILLGRFAARSANRTPAPPAGAAQEKPGAPAAKQPPAKTERAKADLDAFPCKLGDVVLRAGGDEAWLAGALVFSEDAPVSVLFIAPDAGGDRALFVRPAPSPSLAWLSPLPSDAVAGSSEPPNVLELGDARFERVRRLPLRVERLGSGAPDVGDSAIVAEYTSGAGELLLVIASGGNSRAWRGSPLEEGTYDVLPNGEAD